MGAGSQSPPFPGVLGNPSMYNCVIVLTQSSALAKQGAFSWAVTAPNQHPAGQLGSGSTPLNKQCSPSLGLRSQGLEADSCFRNPRPETSAERKATSPPTSALLSQSGRHRVRALTFLKGQGAQWMGRWLSLGGAGEFGDPRTARRSSQGAVPAAQGLQERSGLNRALSRGWGPFQGVGWGWEYRSPNSLENI